MTANLKNQAPRSKVQCGFTTLIQILFSFFTVGMLGALMVLWKVLSLVMKAFRPAWAGLFSSSK
jgi:hypothetical protein